MIFSYLWFFVEHWKIIKLNAQFFNFNTKCMWKRPWKRINWRLPKLALRFFVEYILKNTSWNFCMGWNFNYELFSKSLIKVFIFFLVSVLKKENLKLITCFLGTQLLPFSINKFVPVCSKCCLRTLYISSYTKCSLSFLNLSSNFNLHLSLEDGTMFFDNELINLKFISRVY